MPYGAGRLPAQVLHGASGSGGDHDRYAVLRQILHAARPECRLRQSIPKEDCLRAQRRPGQKGQLIDHEPAPSCQLELKWVPCPASARQEDRLQQVGETGAHLESDHGEAQCGNAWKPSCFVREWWGH